MSKRIWRRALSALCVGALLWSAEAFAVTTRYVYWTGESAVIASAGATTATLSCYTATEGPTLCYPSFAATGTHYAFFHGMIPSDMSTTSPSMTCNVIAAPETATDLVGTIKFTFLVFALPPGYSFYSFAQGGAVANDLTINAAYAYDLAKSTGTTPGAVQLSTTGSACPSDATCIGVPGGVRIARLADDVGDTVEDTPVIVTGVVCSYTAV